ncbi:ABC-F family ATP-binding cassette domain-containing protein [Dyadobacter sp. CY356]|uniref:ABC-F family ATP-binding cassette domain-containing protein n=1 Tax=Dyadobacter sp. CY356 TaxID=2906442 RepID=UPI001F1E50D2|nr:ABC-F family ATP-binding cassette domain-containing protein [Dyadobacter sp. CY356]MCF0054858.1 ATP-binding cassette domain-containing protein [Dyadobacter sp. CY356]
MLFLSDVTYAHPNRDVLFVDINLIINKHEKIALIGNNGSGKSSLLKILTGDLTILSGQVKTDSKPYYVPQIFGQFNHYTIARALGVDIKLSALQNILNGQVTEENLLKLNDDWAIEERCKEALMHWNLQSLDLNQPMDSLSGGQKTKVFLAGIMIHMPEIVLLDEPSNHLDIMSREILYQYIRSATNTLIVVSHDRTLLNLLPKVFELGKQGINVYGGNYDFYAGQKQIESEALNQDIRNREKAFRKAREVERESIERQQKLDARGKKKQEKAGLPKISMNTLKNNAEKSTARIRDVHTEKVGSIAQDLSQLRRELSDTDKMKVDLDNSALHSGKILIDATNMNYGYSTDLLWDNNLTFQITSGERIVISGSNGSGKTTLIKLILAELEPQTGIIERADFRSVYIDQDYSIINNDLSVYKQAEMFNAGVLQEHEIKIRLNRFLFTKNYWDKPCSTLSGGEKMRLILCSLTISNQAPDMIILDEPTNNLDIRNIEILTAAINQYEGTLLIISHDQHFLKEINAERVISL